MTLIVTITVFEVAPAPVARIVALNAPTASDGSATTVRVVDDPRIVDGLHPADNPEGSPVTEMLTVPVKPPLRVIVTGKVFDCPRGTEIEVDPSEKSIAGVSSVGSVESSEHPAAIRSVKAEMISVRRRMHLPP